MEILDLGNPAGVAAGRTNLLERKLRITGTSPVVSLRRNYLHVTLIDSRGHAGLVAEVERWLRVLAGVVPGVRVRVLRAASLVRRGGSGTPSVSLPSADRPITAPRRGGVPRSGRRPDHRRCALTGAGGHGTLPYDESRRNNLARTLVPLAVGAEKRSRR
jgi:hypothetical protein